MKQHLILVLALYFLIPHPVHAQSPVSEQAAIGQCRELASAAMQKVAAGDDIGALEILRRKFPAKSKAFDASRDRTLTERRLLNDRYGKLIGVQFVREERISDFLMRITYVEKRALHLIRWQFTFYRPDSTWQLNAYNWDDNVQALFDRP